MTLEDNNGGKLQSTFYPCASLSYLISNFFLFEPNLVVFQHALLPLQDMSSTWAGWELYCLSWRCLIRPLRVSLADRCGQMQTKDTNPAETSALAFLSSHECICNLNLQPVGNENRMGSAEGIKAWWSHGLPDMKIHNSVVVHGKLKLRFLATECILNYNIICLKVYDCASLPRLSQSLFLDSLYAAEFPS